MARLKEKYREEIVPELMKEFDYSNVMQVPKLEKIVVNVGLGEAVSNAKAIEAAVADISAITGQTTGCDAGQEVDRRIQAARGYADRRDGDVARAAHVRVPRPAGGHHAAADSGFPGRLARTRSMGEAITRWACGSRSPSPRSTTTRSIRRAVSSSASSPAPRTMRKGDGC